jgi:hypothetical protein
LPKSKDNNDFERTNLICVWTNKAAKVFKSSLAFSPDISMGLLTAAYDTYGMASSAVRPFIVVGFYGKKYALWSLVGPDHGCFEFLSIPGMLKHAAGRPQNIFFAPYARESLSPAENPPTEEEDWLAGKYVILHIGNGK